MESFFNKILCDLVGHKETTKTVNLYDVIKNEDIKLDSRKFLRAHETCSFDRKISPSVVVVKCERCGKILKNGPEAFF